jgi:hypothetical protein
MASDPDRHGVVPRIGDDPKDGRARCPSHPSPGTGAPPRSPSSSRCPKDGQPLGPGGHAGLGPHPGRPPTLPDREIRALREPCPSHPQPARAWCRRRVIRCVVADSALDRWASPADRCPTRCPRFRRWRSPVPPQLVLGGPCDRGGGERAGVGPGVVAVLDRRDRQGDGESDGAADPAHRVGLPPRGDKRADGREAHERKRPAPGRRQAGDGRPDWRPPRPAQPPTGPGWPPRPTTPGGQPFVASRPLPWTTPHRSLPCDRG